MILTRPGLRGVLLAALALLIATATPAIAQLPVGVPGAPLPFDPSVRHGALGDGFQYYIKHTAEPAEQARLWLVVRAGSALEEDHQRGLARFVARMALRGTERRSEQEISDHLASMGTQAVAGQTVQTGLDVSLFHLDIPTGSPEAVQAGVELLAEWAYAIAFRPDATATERAAILEDWDTASDIGDSQLAALFGDSRYAQRQPTGVRTVVEGATPEQLAAFYEQWYRPDRMAIIAVGDFEPEAVESAVRSSFAARARGSGEDASARRREAGTRPALAIPDHAEPRVSVITDPDADVAHLTLYRKLRAGTGADLAAYRIRLAQRLIDAMINARLAERQQDGQPYLSAAAGRNRLTGDVDVTIATARVATGGIERGLQALLEELLRVQAHGFTDAELQREKAALTRSVEEAYQARDRRPSHLLAEEYLRHFLEGGPYPGVERERELHRILLPELSAADLHRWAADTLPSGSSPNTVLLVTTPPSGAHAGSGDAAAGGQADAAALEALLLDRLAAAAALAVEPYRVRTNDGSTDDGTTDSDAVDDAIADELLATQPARGSIEAERRVLEVDAHQWTLSNGIIVIAKQTDFADEVLFHAVSSGGTSLVEDADFVPALTAATVVAGSGAGPHDRAALDELLAGKHAAVAPYIAELFEGFNGSAAPQDLETLFQLIYLYATRPRVDGRFYAQYETQLRAHAQQREARPDAVFSDALRSALSQGHFRARPVTPRLLEELDLERAVQVYADRFADFADFTFVFVGAFDWQVLRDLAETYLAALPAGARREQWRDVGIDPPSGIEDRAIRGGPAGRATSRLVFAGDMRWTRGEAVTLTVLSGVMEKRLRDRLPGQANGIAGVGVSSDSQLIPDPEYRVIVGFDSDASHADQARDAVLAEVTWLRRGSERRYLEEALGETKAALRAAREEQGLHNRFWIDQIAATVRNGEPLSEIARFEERLQAVDTTALVNAARRYLTPDRHVRVVLLPE